MAGRKSKLTPELIERFTAAARLAVSVGGAARLLGVPLGTVRNWYERGKREPESIYGRFRTAVKREIVDAFSARLGAKREEEEERSRRGEGSRRGNGPPPQISDLYRRVISVADRLLGQIRHPGRGEKE